MSHGHGSGQKDGGFAALVNSVIDNKKSKTDDDDSSNSQAEKAPSKGLPATGLKKNTLEWQESNESKARENGNGNGNGQRPSSSRQSSSSSIPSNADGSADSRTQKEREHDQEGPRGRGPGGHEPDLRLNDGPMHDSPTEEKATPSIPPPRGSAGDGAATPAPPEYFRDNAKEDIPDRSDDGEHQANGDAGRKGKGKEVNGDVSDDTSDDDDQPPEGIDPEEHVRSRNAKGNRKMTDEAGHYPEGLKGVKDEFPPGSQNEIILGPRLPQIHYHKREVDPDGKRNNQGPILMVTQDGEAEHVPGETPQPSRTPSHDQGAAHSGPSDDEFSSQLKHDLHSMPNGHWSTAVDGSARPKPKARFSSFRDKDAAPPSHRHSHYSLHSLHSHKEGTGESSSSQQQQQQHQQQQPGHHQNRQSNEIVRSPLAGSRSNSQEEVKETAQQGWSLLRSKVLPSRNQSEAGPAPGPGKVSATASTTITSVPITTELLAGQLPVMMLKTWLDRDEDGRKAVPVLLGNMRFRVGDSVGLREGSATGREMFKVECEYGDGAVKWVIYRELRDFLSLHAHYRAANFGTSVGGLRGSRKVDIPDFPRISIPYIKSLQRGGGQGKEKPSSKADYAQASRDALQHYLVELIRAVIFRPESNRLCKFFEISSLTLSLAPRGGFQGKAGFIRLPGSNTSRRSNQPGMSPLSWISDRTPKWFTIRDSYFVATEGPESTEFYEVFLLDQDFAIERPKRAYRTGFHFMTGKGSLRAHKEKGDTVAHAIHPDHQDVIDEEHPFAQEMVIQSGEGKGDAADQLHDDKEHHASQHTFFISNSQRKLKLVTKNARQMHQFIVSMERIAAQSAWTHQNRFDSFAPLRVNVAAQWLVDGRDYFWNLSRAINMAKDRIYIHDWWLSPELYLRRPGDERYRLDNLLKRKAEDGVKIFIIIYNEVSDKTTPVDSTYAKRTLVGLHPNIMVQRSPSHFQTGTFYWSHHEKMCVIDETIAFMGGLDLCYGRWDTSQHVLIDEDHSAPDGPDGPVWRGKDYSNERVVEYYELNKPFDDMIDRKKVPRMPWHDVGMQIVGQPARDICRHFVQRWNLLIRTKNHKRRLPFLIPAADFTERELQDLQLQGTCEVQICRSVGPWSMGTLTKIEHSIQNAYVKSIQLSEHFLYIENQFFITSTVVDGVPIQNGIGDAIVERIIRAHKEGTKWRACIVIPLLPGYTYPIDSGEASSVRLIMECQNRTISRGSRSIFSRLRKEGIEPEDYITFFSLRGWGKFKSGVLTTEQVYIHGKTCIIDDRLVLCGSANINERSQRGDRDSELVSVIRDTDMIDGTMAGKPYKVGRFAHTLRMRLMREHVGVDVDSIEEDQLMSRQPVADADDIETWDPDHEQDREDDDHRAGITQIKRRTARERLMRTVNTGMGQVTKGLSENAKGKMSKAADKVVYPFQVATGHNTIATSRSDKTDPGERRDFDTDGNEQQGFADSMVPTLEEKTIFERRPSAVHGNGKPLFDLIEEGSQGQGSPSPSAAASGIGHPDEATVPSDDKHDNPTVDPEIKPGKTGVPKVRGEANETELFGAPANAQEHDDAPPTRDRDPVSEDDEDYQTNEKEHAAVKARQTLRKHLNAKVGMSAWSMPTPTPKVNPNRFHDPLDDKFWKDMWVAVAVHNTEIFRKVFRCIPDDLITSWAQYKAFTSHAEKFNKAPEDVVGKGGEESVKVVHGGPGTHGAGGGGSGGGAIGAGGHDKEGVESGTRQSDIVDGGPKDYGRYRDNEKMKQGIKEQQGQGHAPQPVGSEGVDPGEKERRVPSSGEQGFHSWEIEEMENLLKEVRGTLVMYSTRFLEAEDLANNFLFNSDKILPLPIFD